MHGPLHGCNKVLFNFYVICEIIVEFYLIKYSSLLLVYFIRVLVAVKEVQYEISAIKLGCSFKLKWWFYLLI